MFETKFILDVTFQYLEIWLKRYLAVYPPPNLRRARLQWESAFYDRDLLLSGQVMAIRGAWRGETDAPLVEIWVTEYDGRAYIRIRLNDPRLAEWFKTLLKTIAPAWNARGPHGLPALPPKPTALAQLAGWLAALAVATPSAEDHSNESVPTTPTAAPARSATTEPPPAARALLPVSPAPAKKNAPRVPRRPADLRRWKAVWREIRPLVQAGNSNSYIVGWLRKHEDDLQVSKETVTRIIAAGAAGKLEETDAN